MLMLALALATMPQPVGPTLPADLGARGVLYAETRPAATRIDLTVDPAGVPIRCDVILSDGMRLLDRTACDLLMRKARFTPARDATGTPMTAIVREDFTVNRATSTDGGRAATAGTIDFAVPVDRLPRGATMMVADAVVMTDPAGKMASCDVARSTGDAAFDRLACRQLATAAFAPARDRDGRPVAALRQVSVGFTAGSVPR